MELQATPSSLLSLSKKEELQAKIKGQNHRATNPPKKKKNHRRCCCHRRRKKREKQDQARYMVATTRAL